VSRDALQEARRVVVKIGSRSLTGTPGRFEVLAKQMAALRGERQVVLVSSGAIAMGREKLGLSARPRDMARLQAAAAAGQASLIHAWERALAPFDVPVAQLLLTHSDLADRDRYLNARASIDALLELGALPIINENDTVAVEEIKFGDNDQLAAMVATLAGADLLVMLSDVAGVLDHDGIRVAQVGSLKEIERFLRAPTDDVGSGGMASKVDAARRATKRGVPVVIADAQDDAILGKVLRGEDVGTLFLPRGAKLPSRKHWIAYTLKTRGELLLDDGAATALAKGASLLAAGVVGVRGDFAPGDCVRLTRDGEEVARGLVRYGVIDVARLAGARQEDVEVRLGRSGSAVLVHRDDMIVGAHA